MGLSLTDGFVRQAPCKKNRGEKNGHSFRRWKTRRC